MIRRPPRSTPFPTRRSSDLAARFRAHPAKSLPVLNADGGLAGTVSRAELYEWLWMSPVRPAESAAKPSLLNWLGQRLPGKRSEERRVGKECRSRWSPYH